MQLKKISVALSLILTAGSIANAEDYVSINYLSYNKDNGTTKIHTPEVEISKDFGADFNFRLSYTHDSVSGASPTFYDSVSGASAKIEDKTITQNQIRYGDIPYEDTRKAFNLALTSRLPSRDELSIGYNYSEESDYVSNELSLGYLFYLDDSKNRSITIEGSYQANDIGVYCFLNTSACDSSSGASGTWKSLAVRNFEIGYTQILNKTSVLKLSMFAILENGYLSNPYMRIVRDFYTSPKITEEKKPGKRKTYGATFEYSKAFSDKLTSILNYRFYDDDWGITSHTVSLHTYYEFNSKFTAGIGWRGYTQSEADFYSNRADYFTYQEYASSDRRVSKFDSYDYSLSLKYKINEKLSINGGIGYYDQPGYFDVTYYNVGLKYKF